MERSNLGNLDGLVALGKDGVDIQPTLLRVMTDLYVQKPTHSVDEERHYTELALRLIDLVDATTRSLVAERLVSYPAAPDAVLKRLARETVGPDLRPDTATPADLTMMQHAKTKNPVADTASAAELSDLFLSANVEERRLILSNIEYAPVVPASPHDQRNHIESIQRIETAALAHRIEIMAQEIERSLGIAKPLARRLIDDATGEPIVVIAKALNMPADVLQRVLLCLGPAISQSIQRVYELAALYEEISPQAASRMAGIWRAATAARPRAVAHQTHYAPEDIRQREQPTARPSIRWEEYSHPLKAERS